MVNAVIQPMASGSDSVLDGTSHRYSLVVPARRTREQDGEALARQATRPAEPPLLGSFLELDPHELVEDWSDDTLEMIRLGALPPLGAPTEAAHAPIPSWFPQPGSPTPAASKAGQPTPPATTRSRVFSALMLSILGTAAAFYLVFIRPETQRHGRLLAELQRTNAEQRARNQTQWSDLASRLATLDAQYIDVKKKLDALRHVGTTVAEPSSLPLGRQDPAARPSLLDAAPTAPTHLRRPSLPTRTQIESGGLAATSEPEKAAPTGNAAANDQAPPAASPSLEATPASIPVETPKPTELRDAMREVASRNTNASARTATLTPGKNDASNPGVACHAADPLCGSLN